MVTGRNASMISVYCQLGKAKSVLVTSMMASVRVVKMKTLLAMLASHLNVEIQPAAYLKNFWHCGGAYSLTNGI